MQAASVDVALRLPIRFMPAPVERTSHPKYVTILLLDQSASTAHALTERKTVLLKRSRCVLTAIRLYAPSIGWSFLLIMSITARKRLPTKYLVSRNALCRPPRVLVLLLQCIIVYKHSKSLLSLVAVSKAPISRAAGRHWEGGRSAPLSSGRQRVYTYPLY